MSWIAFSLNQIDRNPLWQGANIGGKVFRQKAEDPVCRAGFGGLGLKAGTGLAVLRMDRHVAHADFHRIVAEKHPDHPVNRHARPGLIRQHQRRKRQECSAAFSTRKPSTRVVARRTDSSRSAWFRTANCRTSRSVIG